MKLVAMGALTLVIACAGQAATPAGDAVVELDPSPAPAAPPPPAVRPVPPAPADPDLSSLDACGAELRRALAAPRGAVRQRYLFGLGAEQEGELIAAREAYLWVVEEAQGEEAARYTPLAFLGLALMYESGEQLGLARRMLGSAAGVPPSQSQVHLYARYRRGLLDQKLGEHDNAMFEMTQVIQGARTYAEQPCSDLLQRAALKALIASYVVAARPGRAHHFFAPLSGDIGEGHARTVDVLVSLAQAYVAANKRKEAAELLHVLLGRYEPLRPQCLEMGTVLRAIAEAHPDGAAIDALVARHGERCGGPTR